MKKTQFAKLKLGAAPLVLGVALISTPAFAQDAAETAEADDNEIVVTGSLIRNPNLEQSSPVNVTTSDTIELNQSNVAEEILREIPGVVPNIGSSVNNGNGGASYVDLRGLGSTPQHRAARRQPSGPVGACWPRRSEQHPTGFDRAR